METVNPKASIEDIQSVHQMEIRVRYQETDAQGHVHHSNYLNYFEVARTEMLRSCGRSYRDLESSGIMLVVVKATCDYKRGAKYDDVLTILTRLERAKGTRITHRYEISNQQGLVCTGETIVAAVSQEGKPQRLPEWLRLSEPESETKPKSES
jgi:acyl-CoA thioester hydrolase